MTDCGCKVRTDGARGLYSNSIEQCALCKAAPELRDALRELVFVLENPQGKDELSILTDRFYKARAALAKVSHD